MTEMLSDSERKVVLTLARQAIEHYLKTRKEIAYPQDPSLKPHAAAFVTLKQEEELRGCIGIIEDIYPLGETIVKCAISAAIEDPRFPPVKLEELPLLQLEISILSGFREVTDVNEIVVGTHGIHMISDRNRGLLLPQVAVEHNWDRETFLGHTCMKAGLPSNAWKSGKVKIRIFTAEVFGEDNSN